MQKLLAVMVLVWGGMIQANPVAAYEEYQLDHPLHPHHQRRHSHPGAVKPQTAGCLILSDSYGFGCPHSQTKPAEEAPPEQGGAEEELGSKPVKKD